MIGGETQLLVERAATGDEEAQGELLERLRPRLVLWCAGRMSKKLRAKVQPEDVAQEVLLALHKALPALDTSGGRKAFLKWVFRVAENRVRDIAGHHGALKRKTVPPRSFAQTSPSLAAARAEMIGELRAALDELPEDYRTVIQLRRLEEREIDDVAAKMDRSPGATHTLYWRAVAALRDQMKKRGTLQADITF
ncbi:MAG: RNA polymerase sigma factor [Planctomycetota bacterium]|nr:RNA polymerase sigma factor [Planctomycetota bacterium]